MSLFLTSLAFSIILPAGSILLWDEFNHGYPIQFSHHTQQLEIQLSVIHNYASQYLGLVIGSEKPSAKS